MENQWACTQLPVQRKDHQMEIRSTHNRFCALEGIKIASYAKLERGTHSPQQELFKQLTSTQPGGILEAVGRMNSFSVFGRS